MAITSSVLRGPSPLAVSVFFLACFGPSTSRAAPLVADESLAKMRHFSALQTQVAPCIDGRLDDDVWQRAARSSGFRQTRPEPGTPASFATDMQVAYDHEALYFALRCHDPEPDKIVGVVTRRDRITESDWISVEIDSRMDRRSAFTFGVNAAGVKVDGTWFNDSNWSNDWDGVWQSAVVTNAQGWQVELRIPFKILRFKSGRQLSFGLNVMRGISRLRELDLWQYIAPGSDRHVSRAGLLSGLDLHSRPLVISTTPYVSAQAAIDSGTLRPMTLQSFGLGADARASVGDHLNINISINPDFGQVEADEVELNLSTIETFFPEKRPFFLADQDVFKPAGHATPLLFYSRRLGRALPEPEVADGEIAYGVPEMQTIYGAVKMVGRSRGGTSFALLNAEMGPALYDVVSPSARRQQRRLASSENASVLRLSQDLANSSKAGILLTALLAGQEGQAFVGSGDLSLNSPDGDYNFSANLYSSVLDDKRIEQQDEYVRAALHKQGPVGYGADLSLQTLGSGFFAGYLSANYLSANLAINDLGYLSRADLVQARAIASLRRYKKWGFAERAYWNLEAKLNRNTRNVNLGDKLASSLNLEFDNAWSWGMYGRVIPIVCDDRETRSAGEVVFCLSRPRWTAVTWFGSDERKFWVLRGETWMSGNESNQTWAANFELELKPWPQMQISLSPEYQRGQGNLAWVGTEAGLSGERFIFSRRGLEQWNATLRGIYSFSADLSLQAYVQAYVVAIDEAEQYAAHTTHQRSIDAQINERDLVFIGMAPDSADYSWSSLLATLLLRWEFAPGSVAYLVYSASNSKLDSAQGERASFVPAQMGQALALPGSEQRLMFKLSYLVQ